MHRPSKACMPFHAPCLPACHGIACLCFEGLKLSLCAEAIFKLKKAVPLGETMRIECTVRSLKASSTAAAHAASSCRCLQSQTADTQAPVTVPALPS